MKFCFIPVIVPQRQGVALDFVVSLVERRLEQKRYYDRFADVPVTARTLVLRIDREKGRRPHVFEVAHSKVMKVNGKRQRYYKTSFQRPNKIQFAL